VHHHYDLGAFAGYVLSHLGCQALEGGGFGLAIGA
jgi:hypothetical protein